MTEGPHKAIPVIIDGENNTIYWWCPCGWTGASNPVTGWARPANPDTGQTGVDKDHPISSVPMSLDLDEWAKLGIEGMGPRAVYDIEFYCPACEKESLLSTYERFKLAPGRDTFECPACGIVHEVCVEYKTAAGRTDDES